MVTNENPEPHHYLIEIITVSHQSYLSPLTVATVDNMSKLSDYSKFDHIDSDEDEDEDEVAHSPAIAVQQPQERSVQATAAAAPTNNGMATMHKDPDTGRYIFQYNGRVVYQWEQTLDDVTIYVAAPPHVTKGNQINIQIQASHLKLGLTGGNQWFLDEPTFGTVDVSESTWSLEEDERTAASSKVITIYLTKAHRGELWDAALKGNQAVQLDPLSKEEVKKDLMLERFQEENPGFDFRDAKFNGGVPDPRSFMGGVTYS